MAIQIWRHIPGKGLLPLVNLFTAIALIFEGYNQGVYGTISTTPGFIDMAKIGSNGKVTNSTKQGGLAAVYYFGAIFGCFAGGWFSDKFGRRKGVFVGSILCTIGAALMCASQNANMFICARVIAGLGIGFINVIIPPWVSELSEAHDRGASFSLVFSANYLGIAIAYWVNFGIRHTPIEFRWRFPLGLMAVPVLIIFVVITFLPDSPRWLMANGREGEAVEVLRKVRGDLASNDPKIVDEIMQLKAVIEAGSHKRNSIWNMAIGRYSGRLHLGRRVWLGFWLQQIQQWTGILAIATWAGTLFSIAGFDSYKASWLAGLVNTIGIVGTLASALVIDRLGRVRSLLISFVTQGISLFMVAAFIRTSQISSDPAESRRLGVGAACMVFIFLGFFTVFNICPCWLYGSEIQPQEVRARGYSFTILGWAIGCGMNTFVIPIMLNRLGWKTFIIFGVFNIIAIPVIYFLYPEVAGRSLEEINLLFTSNSFLAQKNVSRFHRLIDDAGGNVAVAARRFLDSVDAQYNESGENAVIVEEEEGKARSGHVEKFATLLEPSES